MSKTSILRDGPAAGAASGASHVPPTPREAGREAGQARLSAEGARIRALMDRARPPAEASLAIPIAPAAGPRRVAPQYEAVQTSQGLRPARLTADGFHPVAHVDAFDRMAAADRSRKHVDLTVQQVAAGRAYGALVERVASEGMRCSAPEGRVSGGVEGGSWIDGVLARSDRLAGLRRAIGDGVALVPRSFQSMGDTITVRALVDAVCVEELTLSEVVRRSGWSAKGEHRARLREVLAAALDRLHGAGCS